MKHLSLLLLPALLLCRTAFAQESKAEKRYKYTHDSRTFNSGVSVNVGEYIGIGYKKYLRSNFINIPIGFGNYKVFQSSNALQASFTISPFEPVLDRSYVSKSSERIAGDYSDDYTFLYGIRRQSMAFQLEYLRGRDFFRKYHFYLGAGMQYRSDEFLYAHAFGEGQVEEIRQQTSVGFTAIAGMEYMIDFRPLSFALEFRPFFDLWDGKPTYWPQANLSIRYNFLGNTRTEVCINCER